MDFFSGVNFDNYRNDERIQKKMISRDGSGERYVLLNKNDLFEIYPDIAEDEAVQYELSIRASCGLCHKYGSQLLLNVFSDPSYDIIAIMAIDEITNYEEGEEEDEADRIDRFRGYLICSRDDNNISIELICCNKKVGSNILLGAFMYMVKAFKYKFATLELVGGYKNVSALCAYQKFGFRVKIITHASIDMSVDVNKSFTSKEDIINVFAYSNPNMKYTVPYESHPLCNKFNPNKLPQDRMHLMEDLRVIQKLLAENYTKIRLPENYLQQTYQTNRTEIQDLHNKLALTYEDVEEGRVNVNDDNYKRWISDLQCGDTRKRPREDEVKSRSKSRSKSGSKSRSRSGSKSRSRSGSKGRT